MSGQSLRFGVLGPFAIALNDEAAVVDQAKPRALLAMLVLNANTIVPSGRLIEDLWEHDPPRSAANTLQTYVHRLRARLPPDVLVTREGGYELVVDPASVDAVEFEQLVESAARHGDNPARRVVILRKALGLWRGEALADFAGATWARPEVARLEGLHLDALEHCLESELELGREREVLGELDALVRAHPFRERLSALLMLALYRAGRQTDALRAYEWLRRTLAEELGLEPSEEVAGLERRILTHDTGLDAPTRPSGVSVPLSARVAGIAATRFVGRPSELETLELAFGRVLDGDRATALIGGEPGIGKTSLAATFAHRAAERGAVVLYGHSDSDLGIPFQPWAEALAHLVAHAPQPLLDSHVAVYGGVLSRLVPELVERSTAEIDPGDDTESRRHRLFRAVADLLARVGTTTPVVVLLDDLHWADRSTVELLHFLVALDRPLRLLTLATFRDSEIGPDHLVADALAAFTRLPGMYRMSLGGLDEDELLALLEAAAGESLTEQGVAFRDALMRETDGNPFFVIEILRDLTDTGTITRDATGHWLAKASLRDHGLPVGVRHVVANRVARLGSETAQVLEVAAVIGRDFDLELLGSVAGAADANLVKMCERSVDAALLEHAGTAGRYAFVHALIQHTLYQELGATRRQQLHQRVAQSLEDLYGDADAHVPELARHWRAGSRSSDTRRALHYARRAADLALAALAPSDAARWYRDALELLDPREDGSERVRCALLVGLGRAQTISGDAGARATLLEAGTAAREIGATDLLIAAALATARGDFNQAAAEDADLTILTVAALDAAGTLDTADRVRLLAALMEHTAGSDWELARERAGTAVEVARRLGDDRLLMEAITSTYVARAQPDTLAPRLDDTALALRIADVIGDPLDRFNALFTRYVAVVEHADLVEADRCFREMERLSRSADLTLPHTRFRLLMTRSGRHLLAGDHEGATQAANELLALSGAANVPEALTTGGALLSMISYEQGNVAEMIDGFAAAVGANPDFAVLRAAVAFYYTELTRDHDAQRLLDAERESGFAAISYDINWTTSMTFYADCAAALGDRDAAVDVHSRLVPFSSAIAYNGLTASGAVSRVLGRLDTLLGNYDTASEELYDALDLNRRLRSPFWVTRTQLDLADLLTRRSEPDLERAAALVREAGATARGHGYGGLARHADALLLRLPAS